VERPDLACLLAQRAIDALQRAGGPQRGRRPPLAALPPPGQCLEIGERLVKHALQRRDGVRLVCAPVVGEGPPPLQPGFLCEQRPTWTVDELRQARAEIDAFLQSMEQAEPTGAAGHGKTKAQVEHDHPKFTH